MALALATGLSSGCTADEHEAEPPTEPRSLLADSLLVHWTMEDRTGTTIHDVSGNGRDGTLVDGTFVASPWGEALSLDGIDDYVTFDGARDPSLYDGGVTISARVRVDDAGRYNSLCFGCGPTNYLSVGTSNLGDRLIAAVAHVTGGKRWPAATVGSAQDNTWMDVTVVLEPTGIRFYTDCELDSETNDNYVLWDYSYSSVGEGINPTSWFEGEIDDLRIWDRPLTDDEIAIVCEEPVEVPCSGAPEAASLGIALPQPPTTYTVPSCASPGVTCVNPDNIGTEFDLNSPTIVFADGDYDVDDIPGNFLSIRGQTLIAQNLGGAVLHFGIDAGGNNPLHAGSRIQGLVFDVDDPAAGVPPVGTGTGYGRVIIRTWGAGDDLEVEDVVIDGNGELDTGIFASAPEGLVVRRSHIHDIRRYGILAQRLGGVVTDSMEFSDVYIHDIFEPDVVADPTLATVGAGIVAGESATISDIRVRDVRHTGILVNGESVDTVVERVDVDRIGVGEEVAGVGVYLDNTARGTIVEDFCVGPNTRLGVNSEWDHNTAPRGIDTIVRDGVIESSFFGVGFDQGTVNGTVHDIVFRNYEASAIVFHNNSVSEAAWPTYSNSGSSEYDNTFDGGSSGCDLTYSHSGADPLVCE